MDKEYNFFIERAKGTKKLKEIEPIINPATNTKRGSAYAHTKSGYRPDLGINLRSGWEANVCRVLTTHKIQYNFELTKFDFPVKRGNKAYIPDIFLADTDEWIEVKGYFDHNSFIKLKRFKKYYPKEFDKLHLIIGNSKQSLEYIAALEIPDERILMYNNISKLFKDHTSNWEGK